MPRGRIRRPVAQKEYFMPRSSKVLTMSVLTILLTTGCSRQLPPLQSPARTIPTLDLEPPPEDTGKGRLAFDAENVQGADVSIVTERSSGTACAGTTIAVGSAESTTPVCRAPCVANLPYGNYLIRFSSYAGQTTYAESANVTVGSKLTVVRANLGHVTRPPLTHWMGYVLAAVGGSGVLVSGLSAMDNTESGKRDTVPLLVGGL